MSPDVVVIAGLGEVGKPLAKILTKTYQCCEVDVEPVSISVPCSVLHICYPFQINDFVNITVGYIAKYDPALTIINSTVAPGTTEMIWKASKGRPIAYSPVRGKHAFMERDMLRYKKFVAGCDVHSTEQAAKHFAGAGFQIGTFPTPRIGEVSKLLETTYLGEYVQYEIATRDGHLLRISEMNPRQILEPGTDEIHVMAATDDAVILRR